MARVVLFSGPPGTGKTTLAEAVADALAATVLSWDWLMSGVYAFPEAWAALAEAHDLRRDVGYTIMSRQMEYELRRQRAVVLDCVAREHALTAWRALARQYAAPLALVECRCSDPAIHRSRIDGRQRAITGWTELTWDSVEAGVRLYEPLPGPKLELDAVSPFAENRARVWSFLDLDE